MKETQISSVAGIPMLLALLAALGLCLWGGIEGIRAASPLLIVASLLAGIFVTVLLCGFYMVEPNQAAVLSLFGKYVGTSKEQGLRWNNPFYASRKISLRMRNFESSKLKVNDLDGSPIEIASVVVWQVVDSAEAVYNVDDYESFVHIQSESALRAMATSYPYDQHSDGQVALRSHAAEISKHLTEEIQERLALAGVLVMEARISHLAYAAGDRPGDAAAAAGRRDHRRAHAHRRRRGQHGRDGARASWPSARSSTSTPSAARRWSATCWWCCAASAARSRSSTPARSTDPVAEKKAYPLRINAAGAGRHPALGGRRPALGERADRVPAARRAAQVRAPGAGPGETTNGEPQE